jgi:molecular chaperone IbpA
MENVTMTSFDFTPFYRSTVGFDRLFSRLDDLVGQEAKSYPPYNIEKTGDDKWRVSVAVAGFTPSDIAIESKENSLTIKGAKAPEAAGAKREFLHRGIAERSFELRFQLGDHVEVTGAALNNGLLDIELKLELPESKKARQIPINGAAKAVEDKTAQVN